MQDKNEVSPQDELLGVWRLTSAYVVIQETGERVSLYGDDPRGYLIFHPSGRLMVLITANQPNVAETDLAATQPSHFMVAYSGNFSVDAEQFTTAVDVAWYPSWVGTDQIRFYTLASGKLSIRTAPSSHPAYPGQNVSGYLEWARDDQSPRHGLS